MSEQEMAMAEMLKSSRRFRSLFEQHQQLDDAVAIVTSGKRHMDDVELTRIKKHKLRLRDELEAMLAEHRAAHPA